MPTESELHLHRACFTGHRPHKLHQPKAAVIAALEDKIREAVNNGFVTFISVMAYPPTGSVQTECTRLPVMLRTKGRFHGQRTIGFVGLQKHINSGYAFAERQIAHNGKRGKGTRSPHGLKDYPT